MEEIIDLLEESNRKLATNGKITFSNLNKLYNFQLKSEKNDLYYQIETFWNEYNTALGIDIRDSLYEVGEETVEVYFIDVSDAVSGKKASAYTVGEDVFFKLELRRKDTNELFPCTTFSYIYKIEGVLDENKNLVDYTGIQSGDDGIFALTIPACEIEKSLLLKNGRGALIELVVEATSSKDNIVCEGGATSKGYAGSAIINLRDLKASQPKPSDFEEFWAEQVERVKNTDPTDELAPTEETRYSAIGEHPSILLGDDVDLTNYCHIKKFDKALLNTYRENAVTTASDACLDYLDIYEVYLKAPGPNPVAGILSIPKNKTNMDLEFRYAGYGVSSPSIQLDESVIAFSVSHHGYPSGRSRAEYYSKLYSEVLDSYGAACGKPNSGYANKDDCYILYMFLRNLQAVRFVDESREKDISNLDKNSALYDMYMNLKRAFNGNICIWGGSMGGYQAIGVAALSGIAGYNVVKVNAIVPGFCNTGGPEAEGRIENIFGAKYEDNMDYFDAVFFSEYIKCEIDFSQVGLGDYTCPPSSIIIAYNAVKSKKRMNLYQGAQHDYWPTRFVNGIEEHTNPIYKFSEEAVTDK